MMSRADDLAIEFLGQHHEGPFCLRTRVRTSALVPMDFFPDCSQEKLVRGPRRD
jgi:hypothetical protein